MDLVHLFTLLGWNSLLIKQQNTFKVVKDISKIFKPIFKYDQTYSYFNLLIDFMLSREL